jgi:hypothetical protein
VALVVAALSSCLTATTVRADGALAAAQLEIRGTTLTIPVADAT